MFNIVNVLNIKPKLGVHYNKPKVVKVRIRESKLQTPETFDNVCQKSAIMSRPRIGQHAERPCDMSWKSSLPFSGTPAPPISSHTLQTGPEPGGNNRETRTGLRTPGPTPQAP